MAEPELDRRLAAWRAAHLGAGLALDAVDELEDHLLSSVLDQLSSGASLERAFQRAASELGDPARLASEFSRLHDPMHPLSKLLGIALALGFCVLCGGFASTWFDPAALLLVVGFVAGGLIASFGPLQVGTALRMAFGTRRDADADAWQRSSAVARRGYRLSWAAGAIGGLIGIVRMLSALEDPAHIGPGIAVSLFSVLYGALLAELLFANFASWVDARPALAN